MVRDYTTIAFCVGMLAFACGLVRGSALDTPQAGVTVNGISMAALFLFAATLLAAWQRKPLRINLVLAFIALFPLVTTAFVALPLLPPWYLRVLAAILYAVYNCSLTLVMIQCAQTARDRAISPTFVFGYVAGIIYALHGLGFLSVAAFSSALPAGADPAGALALFGVYGMGIVFFLAQGGFRTAFTPVRLHAGNIEFVTTAAHALRNRPGPAPTGDQTPPEAAGNDPARMGGATQFQDRLSKQCHMLRRQFKLSERETQIVDAIARGNTVAAIAVQFSISENTVRTHTKRLYNKLGIHKKQELLETLSHYDPSTLTEEG